MKALTLKELKIVSGGHPALLAAAGIAGVVFGEKYGKKVGKAVARFINSL